MGTDDVAPKLFRARTGAASGETGGAKSRAAHVDRRLQQSISDIEVSKKGRRFPRQEPSPSCCLTFHPRSEPAARAVGRLDAFNGVPSAPWRLASAPQRRLATPPPPEPADPGL